MSGRDDAGAFGEAQSDLLPGLHAVVVSLLRKLRDGEMVVSIDDRRLGARPAKRRSGREYELEILVRLLVAKDALGHLKEAIELDQGGDARTKRRLKRIVACAAEAESAETDFIGDTEKVVAFGERSNRA